MRNYLFFSFLVVIFVFPLKALSFCQLTASNKLTCANTEIFDSITKLNNFAADTNLDYIYHLSFSSIRFENNEIQKGWLDKIKITFSALTIEHTDLENIGPQSFSGNPFKNLTYLNIVGTKITSIKSNMFEDTSLTSLHLDNNDLDFRSLSVEENCFGILSQSLVILTIRGFLDADNLLNITGPNTKLELLTRLDIGYNNIEKLHTDSFVGAPNLQVLYVDKSEVKTVESDTFNAHNLGTLNLARNKLRTLQEGVFRNVTGISIFDNQWECDCNLLWLKELFTLQPALFTHRQFYCTTSQGEVSYQNVEFCPN